LYCADKLTYKVSAGTVVDFTIYGPHLSRFAHLASYEEFLGVFDKLAMTLTVTDLFCGKGIEHVWWARRRRTHHTLTRVGGFRLG